MGTSREGTSKGTPLSGPARVERGSESLLDLIVEVLDEIGVDISKHKAKSFDDLVDSSFDLVVSLSPEAHHKAMELTRTMAIDVVYWPTMDPSLEMGSREQVLDAYRACRDHLIKRMRERFGETGLPKLR